MYRLKSTWHVRAEKDLMWRQVALHAIGDRAIDEALGAWERVAFGNASGQLLRLEHAQHLGSPATAARCRFCSSYPFCWDWNHRIAHVRPFIQKHVLVSG